MDTSLNAYAAKFETALKKQSQFANFNNDIMHAGIIVCTALRYAEKHVRLLTHKLEPTLYASPWFLEELEGFLKRDGMLRILIESEIAPDHPIKEMQGKFDKLQMNAIPRELLEEYAFNFMTVDDNGFRFEPDRSRPEATVVFNFDQESRFKKLRENCISWFDDIWDRTTESHNQ